MPKLDTCGAGKGHPMPLSSGRLPVGGFAPLVPELDVIDLEASLRFWCEVLGFAVVYDRPERGFAYLEWPFAMPSQSGSRQILLSSWRRGGASIDDQENRALGIGNEALEKFDEDAAVLDHERLRVTAEA